MTNLDPQTTGDFWDAYLRAASAGTKHEVCSSSQRAGVTRAENCPCGNNIRLGPRCAAGSDRCERAT